MIAMLDYFGKPVVAFVIVAWMLGGCSGTVQPSAVPASSTNRAHAATLPPMILTDRRRSWVAANAATASQLLFESDPGTNDVDMFALPDMTLKGRLTGFEEPLGECSDARGNVWIANSLGHELLEYSHRGTLSNTISQARLEPFSCAIDPVTGAIAVVISTLPHGKPGKVLVYSTPSAAPAGLQNPEQYSYAYAAYDPSGNLWVDGTDALGHTILSKCAASHCTTVGLRGGSIFAGTTVAWDGANHTLVVFDQSCHDVQAFCSYPVSPDGLLGLPTAYGSYLSSSLCNVAQVALVTSARGSTVVGADNAFYCGSATTSTVDRWAYPAGGTPTNHEEGGVIFPWGTAVSTK